MAAAEIAPVVEELEPYLGSLLKGAGMSEAAAGKYAKMGVNFLDKHGMSLLNTGTTGASMVVPQLLMTQQMNKQMQAFKPELGVTGSEMQQEWSSYIPTLQRKNLQLDNRDIVNRNTLKYGYDLTHGKDKNVINRVAYKIANNMY